MKRITELSYKKKFNTGSYESEEYGITMSLSEEANPEATMKEMKAFIEDSFNDKLEAKEIVTEPVKKEAPVKEAPVVEAPVKEVETEEEFKKEVKPKKTRKVKTIPYNRSNADHKRSFAEYLDANVPNWKTSGKALGVSESLEGKDFTDAKGEILESFKELCVAGFSSNEL